MAEGDGRNTDRVPATPAIQSGENDPFAGERFGGQVQKVGYVTGPTLGWPNCQQLQATINQLDVNGPNLVGRMDQFIGGTLKTTGITSEQLKQMKDSPQVSVADRVALGVLLDGFSKATNVNVDNPHMTGIQLGNFLKAAAYRDAQQGCLLQKPPTRPPGTI